MATATRKPAKVPPLVGVSEAASMMGLSQQRVSQLRFLRTPRWIEGKRQPVHFPAPAATTPKGPVWTRAQIERHLAGKEPVPVALPPLVGTKEAAEILGVSKQRASQLPLINPRYPQPVAKLTLGALWLRSDVEAFAATDRSPGTPLRRKRTTA